MSNPPPPPPNPKPSAAVNFINSLSRQSHKPRKHSHPAIYPTLHNPQPATTAPFPPPTHRQRHSNSKTHRQQSAAGPAHYPAHALAFLARLQNPNSNQNASVGAKPNPPRPVSAYPHAVHRSDGFSSSDASGQNSHQLVAPSSGHVQPALMSGGGVMPTFATGVSVPANPKVVGQTPVADDNGLKHTRDKSGDDTYAIIRDRKVLVSEGTSLYAQCRSWLKNGVTLEKQPQYADCVKSLPKPLPASVVESRKEDDMETEEEIKDVDNLSAKELLQQHVKHAKKVRGRLRNQRLQKIERYKDRLALLLPPVVDQQTKNDPAS